MNKRELRDFFDSISSHRAIKDMQAQKIENIDGDILDFGIFAENVKNEYFPQLLDDNIGNGILLYDISNNFIDPDMLESFYVNDFKKEYEDINGTELSIYKYYAKMLEEDVSDLIKNIGYFNSPSDYIKIVSNQRKTFLVIRSGSGKYGKKIKQIHEDIAKNDCAEKLEEILNHEKEMREIVGDDYFVDEPIKKMYSDENAYFIQTDNMYEAIMDLSFIQTYALTNRDFILKKILDKFNIKYEENKARDVFTDGIINGKLLNNVINTEESNLIIHDNDTSLYIKQKDRKKNEKYCLFNMTKKSCCLSDFYDCITISNRG